MSYVDPSGEVIQGIIAGAIIGLLVEPVVRGVCKIPGNRCGDVEGTVRNAEALADVITIGSSARKLGIKLIWSKSKNVLSRSLKKLARNEVVEHVGGEVLNEVVRSAIAGDGGSNGGLSTDVVTQAASVTVGLRMGASRSRALPGNGPTAQVSAAGEPAAGASAEQAQARRRPKRYLGVSGYALGVYAKEFSRILDPNFLDAETRSQVEAQIAGEIASLQSNRYSYRSRKGKEKALQRRASDVANSTARLYAQLISALSKHQVIVREMSELPRFSTGGVRRAGVYAGN